MAADEDYYSLTLQTGSKGSIQGTALQLVSAVTRKPRQGVLVKADADNTVPVYVGISTVTAGIAAPTTDGYPLAAGEEVFIATDNPASIYVVTDGTSSAVNYLIN